jgi:GNAT superfamily N-acetyltransferase
MAALTLLDPLLFAEDTWSYTRPWPNQVLEDQGDLVFWNGQMAHRQDANVLRVRLDAASVDRRIDDARAWMADHGRVEFTWCIGASTTPADLASRLLADGAVPDADDPTMTPMVLDHEPPSGPDAIKVERVTSFEDWVRCREIAGEGFAMSDVDRAAARTRLEAEWPYAQSDGASRFLVRLDGEPVAYGVLTNPLVGPPCLAGAATAPKVRGRGMYRALLRARWDVAVANGASAVVTIADKNMRPVLEHLGFRSGPAVSILVDHPQPQT